MQTEADTARAGALKIQRQRLIVGIVSLVVAVVYTQQSLQLNFGSLARPGAGVYPLFLGGLFIIISIVAIVEPLRAIRSGSSRDATLIDTMAGDDVAAAVELAQEVAGDARRAAFYVAVLAGYIVALPVLGFTLANIAFITVVGLGLGVDLSLRSRINVVIVAVAFSLSMTWFFVSFLGTRMPRGLFVG